MRLHFQPGNLIAVIVGLGFIGMGVYGYQYMSRFIDRAVETSAVVVDVVYESGTKKGRIHPVVRFRTLQGVEIVARSEEHHNVKAGDNVTLLYDRDHPKHIEITTLTRAQNRRVLFTLLSILLGAVVCGLGVAIDVSGRRAHPL